MVAGLDVLRAKLMKKFLLTMTVIAAGCSSGDATTSRGEPVVDSPRILVDSVFPVEEEIRRFKLTRGLGASYTLRDGASTREELVAAFIDALARADTARLSRMALDAGEFIDLYYPTSIFARPPYKQSPELRWFLLHQNSAKGLARLLQRYGGADSGYRGFQCSVSEPEGDNLIWDRCTVTWTPHREPVRLFSTIIERDGHFKFVSFANDL